MTLDVLRMILWDQIAHDTQFVYNADMMDVTVDQIVQMEVQRMRRTSCSEQDLVVTSYAQFYHTGV